MSVCKKFHALAEWFQYEQGNKNPPTRRGVVLLARLKAKKKKGSSRFLILPSALKTNPSSQGCLRWTPLFSCGTIQIWAYEKIVILTWLTLLLTALPRLLSWSPWLSPSRSRSPKTPRLYLSARVFCCAFAVFRIRSHPDWATSVQKERKKKQKKDKRRRCGKRGKTKAERLAAQHFHRRSEDVVNLPLIN